jgi:hypothetical protein
LPQTQYFAVPDDLYVYRADDMTAESPPTQGCSSGYGLARNVSPLAPASPYPAEERSDVYSSEDDEAEESSVSEGLVSRLSHRERRVLRHALYRWQGLKEQHLYPGLRVGPLYFTVDADTSDSECVSPRSSTQDFELSSTSGFDASFIEGGYESYEDSEMYYSDSFSEPESEDYFNYDYCSDYRDWPSHPARDSVRDSWPAHRARMPWLFFGKHFYRLRAPLTAIDPVNPQIPSRLNPHGGG